MDSTTSMMIRSFAVLAIVVYACALPTEMDRLVPETAAKLLVSPQSEAPPAKPVFPNGPNAPINRFFSSKTDEKALPSETAQRFLQSKRPKAASRSHQQMLQNNIVAQHDDYISLEKTKNILESSPHFDRETCPECIQALERALQVHDELFDLEAAHASREERLEEVLDAHTAQEKLYEGTLKAKQRSESLINKFLEQTMTELVNFENSKYVTNKFQQLDKRLMKLLPQYDGPPDDSSPVDTILKTAIQSGMQTLVAQLKAKLQAVKVRDFADLEHEVLLHAMQNEVDRQQSALHDAQQRQTTTEKDLKSHQNILVEKAKEAKEAETEARKHCTKVMGLAHYLEHLDSVGHEDDPGTLRVSH